MDQFPQTFPKTSPNTSFSVGLDPVDPTILDEKQRENEFGRIILRAIERKAARSQKIVHPKRSKTQLVSDNS
jgi:hypothetical protein